MVMPAYFLNRVSLDSRRTRLTKINELHLKRLWVKIQAEVADLKD